VHRAFYLRVRPPGFWGPVARACGEDPREPLATLAQGLIAMGLAATALFAALVAAGTWLISSPPPTFVPSSSAWIGGLCALAVGATILLRRRLSRRERVPSRVAGPSDHVL
jgi:hypothetical protein